MLPVRPIAITTTDRHIEVAIILVKVPDPLAPLEQVKRQHNPHGDRNEMMPTLGEILVRLVKEVLV